jgi:16S rRNA (adenine1518-N6/adenine1519-N6)-dimethyltransferase
MSGASVRATLGRHGLRAHRNLGQNFLRDTGIADRLVRHAGVTEADLVIEIGPGLGVLTRALAARAARVVAIEVDAGLVRALGEDGALPPNVTLLHADALRVDLRALAAQAGSPVRVVANLPYAISSPLLRRLLDLRDVLADWSVMVQREVADRIRAAPRGRDYGSLSVLHALTVRVDRGIDVAPGAFYPVPRVASAFVRLVPRADAGIDAHALAAVERVARAAFGQRRKTIANALRGGLRGAAGTVVPAARIASALEAVGIDPRARAESVEPARFLVLARALDAETEA